MFQLGVDFVSREVDDEDGDTAMIIEDTEHLPLLSPQSPSRISLLQLFQHYLPREHP